jgi:antitoxin (DNA-binding transcriptional repressor) of toxin-antitoxin stability system
MKVTATALRRNIYAILDEVLNSGIPIEVVRKGKVLKIVPEQKTSKLDRIPPCPDLWVGDPQDVLKPIDWMKEWREPEILDAMDQKYGALKHGAKSKRAAAPAVRRKPRSRRTPA